MGNWTVKDFGVEVTDIQGRSQTSYTALCNGVMASSAMGLNLRVFGFLLTTHAKQMYFSALCGVLRMFHHTRTAVDAGDIRSWRTAVFDYRKNPKTPAAPCWDMGSGISLVEIHNHVFLEDFLQCFQIRKQLLHSKNYLILQICQWPAWLLKC